MKLHFDATNSWNGYNYQGKVAIYHVLDIIHNYPDEVENGVYQIELEWLEDFSILIFDGNDYVYNTIHQVKAINKTSIKDYSSALYNILHKCSKYDSIINGFLHTCEEINHFRCISDDVIRKGIKEDKYIKELEDIVENSNKRNEVLKQYENGKSNFAKFLEENKNNKIKTEVDLFNTCDYLLNKITEEIPTQLSQLKTRISIVNPYTYYTGKSYCEIENIDELIINKIGTFSYHEENNIKEYYQIVYRYLKELIDKHVTERHKNYSNKAEIRINLNEFKKILNNNNLDKRGEHYYIIKSKELINDFLDKYKYSCIENAECNECDIKHCDIKLLEQNMRIRSNSEILQFLVNTFLHRSINFLTDEIKSISYINQDSLETMFNILKDIILKIEFCPKSKIFYYTYNKKYYLASSINAPNRVYKKRETCYDILKNKNIVSILREMDFIISEHIDCPSIYKEASKYTAYDEEKYTNHILHNKTVGMISNKTFTDTTNE